MSLNMVIDDTGSFHVKKHRKVWANGGGTLRGLQDKNAADYGGLLPYHGLNCLIVILAQA